MKQNIYIITRHSTLPICPNNPPNSASPPPNNMSIYIYNMIGFCKMYQTSIV